MKITEITFVSYAVTDVKRARTFYEGILGLKTGNVWEGEDMAFVEYEIGTAHTLVIGMGAPEFTPGKTGATAVLEVDDFDKAVAELREHKINFVMEPLETSVCHMALINDPDGNQIMIHRRKQAQK